MKGGVWPTMRLSVIAVAVAIVFAGSLGPVSAHADSPSDRPPEQRPPVTRPHTRQGHQPHNPNADHPASDVMVRAAVPPDLDQRRRDGHMTPDERRLLRQHIEDAVRELYKR
jgi:hypothetical protein